MGVLVRIFMERLKTQSLDHVSKYVHYEHLAVTRIASTLQPICPSKQRNAMVFNLSTVAFKGTPVQAYYQNRVTWH